MTESEALGRLRDAALRWSDEALTVKQAQVTLDENHDGESVTRVLLLLADPQDDTWDVDRVRELRRSLGQLATELELPPVSLTLVAESERVEAGVFPQ
jgi:hypothetical protein